MGKGGSSGSSKRAANFQPQSVPQSLYGLGADINSFRQKDLENLFSTPLDITNWALNAAGVPAQQSPEAYMLGNVQTYSGGPSAAQAQNPYLAQAQSLWQQMLGNAYNLLSEGQSAWNTGTGIVGQGQGIVGTGQGIVGQGQNAFAQGQDVFSQGLGQLQSIISQYPEIQSALSQLPSYQAIMSTGLTPEQQAYVNQATQAQKAGVTQQMQGMGLGSSTMLQEKLGGAEEAGAATAGSLIQQNIVAATGAANAAANAVQERINQEQAQAGVAGQEITGGISQETAGTGLIQAGTGVMGAGTNLINAGQNEQQLGLTAQTDGTNYLNTIATANVALQKQMFEEAMSGYGVLGQLLDAQMKVYNLQLGGEQTKIQASNTGMKVRANMDSAQQSAQGSGFSSLLSGIGDLLGSSPKGGSGLLGLFGGGTATAATGGGAGAVGATAGGAAAGGGGAIAGIGSAVGTALTALGAAFCQVGRELFGLENPEWLHLRDVMLFRGPKWLRQGYVRYAPTIARWLKNKETLKKALRFLLRRIVLR